MHRPAATEPVNLRSIQRDYVSKALSEQQGHKYLVLDEFTMECLTVAFFRSELFEFGVFDTMLLKNVEHLTTQGGTVGVLLVRPTEENISLINAMLSNPPFSKAFLCMLRSPDFTNELSNPVIESIAKADERGIVECVKEVFIDYYVTDPEIFNLKLPSLIGTLTSPDLAEGDEEYRLNQRLFLKRAVDGLFAVCMALRRIPTISYSVDSKLSQKITESLSDRVDKEYTQNHRDFLPEGLDLLIFDRREDPITPLIYNWSYQSLVNEFLGIEANSVKIKGSSHLFARQTDDILLDTNWNRNYGEFTRSLREEIQRVAQDNSKNGVKMDNIQDIQAVLDKLPSQSKHEKAILKHNDVIRAIIDAVETGDIFSVSRLQQDIITENNKSEQFNSLATILTNKVVSNTDKIKLVMLYCLKYHDDLDRVSRLKRAVASQNLPEVLKDDSGSHQKPARLRCGEQKKHH